MLPRFLYVTGAAGRGWPASTSSQDSTIGHSSHFRRYSLSALPARRVVRSRHLGIPSVRLCRHANYVASQCSDECTARTLLRSRQATAIDKISFSQGKSANDYRHHGYFRADTGRMSHLRALKSNAIETEDQVNHICNPTSL